MNKRPFTYILTNKRNGTLYIGVTTKLAQRVWQHINSITTGFTDNYHVKKLVYYEEHISINATITRKKCLKRWKREWKIALIESLNPDWDDLFEKIIL